MSASSRGMLERVGIRFRARARDVPVAAVALAFRRSLEETTRAIEILTGGTPDDETSWAPIPTDDNPAADPVDTGRGNGGGVRSSNDDGERSTFKYVYIERSDRNVERERSPAYARATDADELAHLLADELADHDNLPALRKLVREHPREQLVEALRRTKAIPADKIRRSLAAVFTGVVRRIARAERGAAH